MRPPTAGEAAAAALAAPLAAWAGFVAAPALDGGVSLGSLFDEAHGGRRAMGAAVPGPVCRLRGGVAAHPAQPAPRRGARQRPVG